MKLGNNVVPLAYKKWLDIRASERNADDPPMKGYVKATRGSIFRSSRMTKLAKLKKRAEKKIRNVIDQQLRPRKGKKR